MKILKDNIIASFFIITIMWISFVPATITAGYANIIYLILGLFLALSFFCSKKPGYFIYDGFDKVVWLFLIWNLFSALFAYDKHAALKRYIDFVVPFITIYFLAKNELDNKKIRTFLYLLFFAGVIVSIIGILEFIYGKDIIYEGFAENSFYKQYIAIPRVMSTMLHPTILGTYLMLCLPASYFVIENNAGRLKKIFSTIGLFIILIAIMLTFSRTAWDISALVTFYYFYNRDKKKILLSVVVMILFLCATLVLAKFEPRLQYRVDYKQIVSYLINGHRLKRYPLTIKMVKDHPFRGVGPNNYRLLFDKYYGLNKEPYNIKIPDNMYLAILGETGLVGILLFMILVLYIIKKGFILLRDKKNKNWDIGLAIFSCLIGILLHMVSYDLFYWVVPYYLFLLFLGALMARWLN